MLIVRPPLKLSISLFVRKQSVILIENYLHAQASALANTGYGGDSSIVALLGGCMNTRRRRKVSRSRALLLDILLIFASSLLENAPEMRVLCAPSEQTEHFVFRSWRKIFIVTSCVTAGAALNTRTGTGFILRKTVPLLRGVAHWKSSC